MSAHVWGVRVCVLQSPALPKLQTLFYQILSRLVFKGVNIDLFPQFIAPFTHQLRQLQGVTNLRGMPKSMVTQVVLLVHKLQGIVSSVHSMAVYQMFYQCPHTQIHMPAHSSCPCQPLSFCPCADLVHVLLCLCCRVFRGEQFPDARASPGGVLLGHADGASSHALLLLGAHPEQVAAHPV